jgi:hypothetical protein
MQTKICPECGDDIYVNARSHKCGWRFHAEVIIDRSAHRMTPEAKAAYESGAPRSHDLAPQQWYNVCRFWTSVAKRCSRPMELVGPDHPLHATSRLGPLLKHRIDPEAEAERQALQAGL